MKECFKCNRVLPLTEFYKHSEMKDGRLNKCKCCAKRDVRENRKSKEDYYKSYDRNRPSRRERERVERQNEKARYRYKTDPEFREKRLRIQSDWSNRNKEKRAATTKVGNAIRDGKIFKPDKCTGCGSTEGVEGHHWSYLVEYSLDVAWLCSVCHGKEHKRLNDEARKAGLSKWEDLPKEVKRNEKLFKGEFYEFR